MKSILVIENLNMANMLIKATRKRLDINIINNERVPVITEDELEFGSVTTTQEVEFDTEVVWKIEKKILNPQALAGCGGTVYYTQDYGQTWSPASGETIEGEISSMCYLGNGLVLLGDPGAIPGGKLYRSTDYGKTWEYLTQVDPLNHLIHLFHMGNGTVIAMTSITTYKSNDYGQTWTSTSSFEYPYSLLYAEKLPNNNILASVISSDSEYPHQIRLSSDYGLTWNMVLDTGYSQVSCIKHLEGGIVLAINNYSQVYRSDDYGQTWYLWSSIPDITAPVTVACYLGNGIVLAGADKLVRSTDYGKTWNTIMDVPGDVTSLAYLNNGIVLLGTTYDPEVGGGCIYRSTDYGETWTHVTVLEQMVAPIISLLG